MAAGDRPIRAEAQPDEHIAAETLDERQAFVHFALVRNFDHKRPIRKAFQYLFDQAEALLDFPNAHPDARVDIALVENRHLELQRVVGRIARRAARIDGAARGAADIAAGAELPRKLALEDAGGYGAVLQRGGIVVNFDQ